MGFYINPNEPKEEWLKKNAKQIEIPSWPGCGHGYALVCLVDNGGFTAAGILFDRIEFDRAMRSGPERPRTWWVAKISDLKTVSDITDDYFEAGRL